VSVELAPEKVIKTYAYNGMIPGPVLRLQAGRQVSINIVNDTDIDNIIHWHGLFVPLASLREFPLRFWRLRTGKFKEMRCQYQTGWTD
jgi:FtsP/CotA-like multicopper oxidase with cupredoxin domain